MYVSIEGNVETAVEKQNTFIQVLVHRMTLPSMKEIITLSKLTIDR